MIIGICGLIGSGKDTAGKVLIDQCGFEKVSFAIVLKDVVAALFSWDRNLLEGATAESRHWREQKDQWWSDKLDMDVTPRKMLQIMGTEVLRKGFHDNIWVHALSKKMAENPDKNYVITDVRFPNEIASIIEAGGKVIQIDRGQRPDWYYLASRVNNGGAVEDKGLLSILPHESEWRWVGNHHISDVINNNYGLDYLESEILNTYENFSDEEHDLNETV